MDSYPLKTILEALIFASQTPLTEKQILAILPEETSESINAALAELQQDYAERPFTIKKISGGWQFVSRPEFSPWITRLFEEKARSRLSRAALETLAIIAFKQPISRVEVSAIRGVNSDGVIKTLLDARLITIAGRDQGPGRALLFKTTPEFLRYFGINDISDLPKPKEVEELLAAGEGSQLLKEMPEVGLEPVLEPEEARKDDAQAEQEQKSEQVDAAE